MTILKSTATTVRASAALDAGWNLGTAVKIGSECLLTVAVAYTRNVGSVTGRVRMRAMESIDGGTTYRPMTRRIAAVLTAGDAVERVVDVVGERPVTAATDSYTWAVRCAGAPLVRVDFYDIGDQVNRGTLSATASVSTAPLAGDEQPSPDVVVTSSALPTGAAQEWTLATTGASALPIAMTNVDAVRYAALPAGTYLMAVYNASDPTAVCWIATGAAPVPPAANAFAAAGTHALLPNMQQSVTVAVGDLHGLMSAGTATLVIRKAA